MTISAPTRTKNAAATVNKLVFKPKSRGYLPKGLCMLASLLIIIILAVVLGNIVIGGTGMITWDFLSSPPENGMESGGIFPAIFGTVALVILM
ncbi:MAG: hypothetical protein DRP45_03225, partial [Candidatus Zixiibacteriota bacterium]